MEDYNVIFKCCLLVLPCFNFWGSGLNLSWVAGDGFEKGLLSLLLHLVYNLFFQVFSPLKIFLKWQQLLALEERMGTVSTALTEETLSECLKKSVYQSSPSDNEAESCNEPKDDTKCSICQVSLSRFEPFKALRLSLSTIMALTYFPWWIDGLPASCSIFDWQYHKIGISFQQS